MDVELSVCFFYSSVLTKRRCGEKCVGSQRTRIHAEQPQETQAIENNRQHPTHSAETNGHQPEPHSPDSGLPRLWRSYTDPRREHLKFSASSWSAHFGVFWHSLHSFTQRKKDLRVQVEHLVPRRRFGTGHCATPDKAQHVAHWLSLPTQPKRGRTPI